MAMSKNFPQKCRFGVSADLKIHFLTELTECTGF